MLNTLGDEFPRRRSRTWARRSGRGAGARRRLLLKDPYDDEVELQDALGLTNDQIDQIRDFVTFRARADPTSSRSRSTASRLPTRWRRAPININARRPRSAGRGPQRHRRVRKARGKGPKKESLVIDLAKARRSPTTSSPAATSTRSTRAGRSATRTRTGCTCTRTRSTRRPC